MYKSIRIFLAVATALSAGCYDRHTLPDNPGEAETATISIAEFKRQCAEGVPEIDADAIIAGLVTTSDEAGNFYKSFFIEDSSGGIEIMAGTYDIHNRYPVGVTVSVRLKGCAAAPSYGGLQVGLPAADYSLDEVSYFESDILLDRHIAHGTEISVVMPAEIRVSDASTDACGRLVVIRGLKYVPEESDTDRAFRGYRRFEDADGNAIYTYVSDYADFAGEEIPESELSVCGILQYGNVTGKGDRYIIKPRSADDYEVDNSDSIGS